MKLPEHIPQDIRRHLPVDQLEWLPTPPALTTEEMIAAVASWIDRIADKMSPSWRDEHLRKTVRECIRTGTLSRLQVIKAAERYHEIDMALREMIAEELDDLDGLPELERTSLRAYLQRAVLRAPTSDPRGYHASPYNRDIAICVLMSLAMICWPQLKFSRGEGSKKPSASLIVAEALTRRGIGGLTHGRVAKIYSEFGNIAKRMSGLIPA